ncbi:MAG: HAD-IIIA family hydrolase [Candidatus Gastranaerophilales bacterium]|nr:HAD-IIIA family hydrolase [Candidatus Gastranaerophilales bacterium]
MFNIELRNRAAKIKMVVFDVDGVMTDGSITYDDKGIEYKTFNAKDGQGIVMITKAGIITAIITARESAVVKHRFNNLGMTKLYMGQKHKIIALRELLAEYNLDASQVAYMGDDLPDICVLKEVGFACCPSDAVNEVKDICHFISAKRGGRGAVRELTDLIYKIQKLSV